MTISVKTKTRVDQISEALRKYGVVVHVCDARAHFEIKFANEDEVDDSYSGCWSSEVTCHSETMLLGCLRSAIRAVNCVRRSGG
jgi:hypothetical protein